MLSTVKSKKFVYLLIMGVTFLAAGPAAALEPLDTFFSQQTYLTQIKANQAWNEKRESPEIVVAVIDTGVDITNPDLVNNIWRNTDEVPGNGLDDDRNGYIDDLHGWDFITDSPDVRPKFDASGYSSLAMHHGTAVAGIIGAEGGNNMGIAGLSWQIQLMPLRVLDSLGEGRSDKVIHAINYAIDNGADIINLSFVGVEEQLADPRSVDILKLIIQRAYNAGVLIVAAAGNELTVGLDLDSQPLFPVCQSGPNGESWILGVAAVDIYDRKASFSNYGASCIDVAAPGVSIFSTLFVSQEQPKFDKPYGIFLSGTSVAAPQVTGLAALLKSVNPGLSLAELQRIIIETTDDIEYVNRLTSWSGKIGSGRLNVFKAVSTARQFSPQQLSNSSSVMIATGAGPGGGPHVRLFDLNGDLRLQFFAFEADFTGGVNTAVADLDANGDLEIITAPQSQREPEVRIFDHFGRLRARFLAFDKASQNGLQVAVGDVNGDGQLEIIAALNQDGPPLIRIFSQEGQQLSQFYAYNRLFLNGVRFSVADMDNDGQAEIITVPGANTSPLVKIFDASGALQDQFMAGPPDELRGLTVAAWRGNIITGSLAGGPPLVRVFNRLGLLQHEWLAYDINFSGGVNVLVADLNNDGRANVVTGPGPGGGPHLKIFSQSGDLLKHWMAYNPGFRGGLALGLQIHD